jgi:hypothetical protein
MSLAKPIIYSIMGMVFGEVGANESKADLCYADEYMIASCRLDEAKSRILSFCAGANNKIIFYRFGTVSMTELTRLCSSENPVFRWIDAATYTTYFGFRSSGYAYVFGVPQETLGAKAFLEVTSLNRSVMSRTCTDNSFGRKTIVSEAVREVEDSVVRGADFLFPPDNIMLDENSKLKRE